MFFRKTVMLFLLAVSFLAVSCGGGGGGGSDDGDSGGDTTSTSVYGTAAEGSAFSGTVYLADSEGRISTGKAISSNGSFSIEAASYTAPFFLKAVSADGNTVFASYIPDYGRVNINPFTHLAFLLASDGAATIDEVMDNTTAFSETASAYETAITEVNDMFGALYEVYGSSGDPFYSEFSVGDTTDGILDDLTIFFDAESAEIYSAESGYHLISAPYAGTADVNYDNTTASDILDSSYIQDITVSPASAVIPVSGTQRLVAVGTFADAQAEDISRVVAWSSSVPSIASVTDGAVTGMASGSATISAAVGGVTGSSVITVSSAGEYLLGVSVTPSAASIPFGNTIQLTATGIYFNASSNATRTADITDEVVWSSSNTAVLTVSASSGTKGLVIAGSAGSATVTASLDGFDDSTSITVTNASLRYVEITPDAPVNAPGSTRAFTLTGYYSDDTTADLTQEATWYSETQTVGTVSNTAGTKGILAAVAQGTTKITATYGAESDNTIATVAPISLVSIGVTPASSSVAAGNILQLTATGTYSDNSTGDITDTVTWSTTSGTIATVASGLVTAKAAGSVNISALKDGIMGLAAVTVTGAELSRIEVTPGAPEAALGYTQQFTATGVFTDNSTQDITESVVWASSNSAVADISNASGTKGFAQTLMTGTATVTASLNGLTSVGVAFTVTSAEVTEIQVTPEGVSVPLGLTQQFTATAVYSDSTTANVTTSVTWYVSEPYAAVSNASGTKGQARTIATGTTSVQAVYGSLSDQTNFTVTPAELTTVQIEPASLTLAKGNTKQYKATGIYTDLTTQDITSAATWQSSDTAVASVSNVPGSKGYLQTLSAGTSNITAVLNSISATSPLTVNGVQLQYISITPINSSLALGSDVQMQAVGIYSDYTTQDLTDTVTWSSDNATAATVSNALGTEGYVTSTGEGMTMVRASYSGVAGSTKLTVTPAELVAIVVSPLSASLPMGNSQQYTATGYYSDSTSVVLTNSVAWTSDATGVITVSNADGSRGLASTVSVGSANITAGLDGVTATVPVTVTAAALDSITVTPASLSIPDGTTQQFTATGNYTNGTTQNITTSVTWLSSDVAVASISNTTPNKGLATAVNAGTATILAAYSGKAGSTDLTVQPATLVSLAITPASASIPYGTTQQFTVIGTYSDASTADLTASVTWTSSDNSVASISNTSGSEGLATSISIGGPITITATMGSVTDTSTLTVSSAVLSSIEMSPAVDSIAVGDTVSIKAIGHYSGGGILDITELATWTSDTGSIASVGNTAGVDKGVVTGVVGGTTNINADYLSQTGTAAITVTGYPLVSITVTPANNTIVHPANLAYTATGTYSDSSTEDITSSVTWSTSNPSVITIDTAGLATTVATGASNVIATKSGVQGLTSITVN